MNFISQIEHCLFMKSNKCKLIPFIIETITTCYNSVSNESLAIRKITGKNLYHELCEYLVSCKLNSNLLELQIIISQFSSADKCCNCFLFSGRTLSVGFLLLFLANKLFKLIQTLFLKIQGLSKVGTKRKQYNVYCILKCISEGNFQKMRQKSSKTTFLS